MESAISSKKNNFQAGCLIFIFGVFAVVGLFTFAVNFVAPMAGVWRAQNWTPTTCTIQSSSVESRGSGDESKFYPEVKYSYSFNGQSYAASQFSLFKIARSNSSDVQTLLGVFSTGAKSQCFVNPQNPAQAVLDRSILREAAIGLIPLVFVLAGLTGIFWQFNTARQAKQNAALGAANWKPKALQRELSTASSAASNMGASSSYSLPDSRSEAIRLHPTTTRAGSCLAMGLFTLFWNGFISFALWHLVFQSSGRDFGRIFPILFLIPFVLIGILMLFITLSCVATLFNSRIILRMSTPQAIPGSNFELSWEIQKSLFNPQRWSLTLEAREETTHTKESDTITGNSVFYSHEFFAAGSFKAMQHGQQSLMIPEGAMHSFVAPHNKIIWVVKVHGAPKFGVAIKEDYEILVPPAPGLQRLEYSGAAVQTVANSS